LQRELFLHAVANTAIKTQRDVLNAYMTAYFNAWLDYQGLYEAKKHVTAFVPRVNMYPDNVARFFRDYPDGRLISVIRDPKSWYASSHRKGPQNYPSPQAALPIWAGSAQAMLDNKQRYPDKVYLLSFEGLIGDTPGTMRKLADWLGIDFDPILTEPTFQKMPIKANTAFSTDRYGVIAEPLKRAEVLSADDTAYIDTHGVPLYERVLQALD
jgi:hypothetical protein